MSNISILEKIARACIFTIMMIEAIPMMDPPDDAMVEAVPPPVANVAPLAAPLTPDPVAVPAATPVVIAATAADDPLDVATAAELVADIATTVMPSTPAEKLTTLAMVVAAPGLSTVLFRSSHLSVAGSSTPA